MNYGLFYHVTTDATASTTILLSHWVYILPNLDVTNQFNTAYASSVTINDASYAITAQKLCYGSSDAGIVYIN